MEMVRIINQETYISFPLISSTTYEPFGTSAWNSLTNTSIVSYSWTDSTSAVSHTITSTPVRIGTTGLWQLHLTQAEMNPNSGNADYIIIKFDATEIEAQTILLKLVTADVYDTTNSIKLKTDNLPSDPASNTVVYSRLATSGYIDVSSNVSAIKAKTDLLSFSGTNLNTRVLDAGILNNITVADILNSTIDTKTVEEILEILLAYATGRISVSGSVFTYYRQNNSSTLFTLTGSDTQRTRS